MQIHNLLDKEEYIDEVSYLQWNEWHKNIKNWLSKEDIKKRVNTIYNSQKGIPSIFIAIENNILVGTISFWISDISERQDLFSFLASLIVKSKYRNRWIWKLLIQQVCSFAKKQGWDNIFLYDESNIPNFYKNNWFTFFSNDIWNNKRYLIYKKEI